MESVFFQSVLVKPPRIMGVQLRPFSAYHALVLLQFDSPFMFKGALPELGDIAFALCVMSDGFGTSGKRYEKLINSKLYKVFWFIKMALCSDHQQIMIMRDIDRHIDGYTQYPEVWSSNGAGKSSSIPWPFKVVATLWQHFGLGENSAWDMGLSKAASYRAAFAEDMGADIVKEWGIEGRHGRWMKSPNRDKYDSIEEFEAAEVYNG